MTLIGRRLLLYTEDSAPPAPPSAAQYQWYDTTRDDILTCARKLTRVSLIYRTEATTKSGKTEKKPLKIKHGCSEVSVNNPRIRGVSPEEEKKGYAREGFVEKEGLKPGMKE